MIGELERSLGSLANREWFRVLIIEDDPLAMRTVNLVLKRGFRNRVTTEFASSLEGAFDALGQRQFDVVLLDLNLPGSSGMETLDRFLGSGSDCAVIVLTGYDCEEMGLQAVQKGAQDYLIKGEFNDKVLIRALRYAKERYRMMRTLDRLAVVDELTGLFNRRGFFRLAYEALETLPDDNNLPSGVLYFDLDGFKIVNDTYGHETGDAALRLFSDCLRHIFHEPQLLARLGGDEFVVFLPRYHREEVSSLIERLQAEAVRICEERDLPFHIRFSHGAASSEEAGDGGDSLDSILRYADRRLYEMKRDRGPVRRELQPVGA